MRRITTQAGHEAWNTLMGVTISSTSPAIVHEDAPANTTAGITANFVPPNNPPEGPQMVLFALIAWLLYCAMPAWNGGVGQ